MTDITKGMALCVYQRKVLLELCTQLCDTMRENADDPLVIRAQALLASTIVDVFRKDIENERTVEVVVPGHVDAADRDRTIQSGRAYRDAAVRHHQSEERERERLATLDRDKEQSGES